MPPLTRHAVVIGGSIAGIAGKCSARPSDRVIVLEKDDPHRRREGGTGRGTGLAPAPADRRADRAGSASSLASSTTWCARRSKSAAAQYRIRLGGTHGKSRHRDVRSSAREGRCSNGVLPARQRTAHRLPLRIGGGRSRLRPRQQCHRRRRRGQWRRRQATVLPVVPAGSS